MLIEDRTVKEEQDFREVSASIDGFRLWYRVPRGLAVRETGDPFLAAALLPAMLEGKGLKLDPALTVSPKLLDNVRLLQDIHNCWNPALEIVSVEGRPRAAESVNTGTMAFFSGGVDSTYTFLKNREAISHLVFIQGFDFYAGDQTTGEQALFSKDDIADLAQLAHKLDAGLDRMSAFLREALSETTRASLSEYRRTGFGAAALEKGLAGDLGRVIAGSRLFQVRRFKGVRLRPETRELLAPEPLEVRRLNRLLLEDAYPLEIARRDGSAYVAAVARNREFAAAFEKTLVPVSTNYFAFGYRYNLSRNLSQGGALASVALLLGFPRALLAASYPYDQLFPLGSHPLTDPLWSVEGTAVVHEGLEARRVDKVRSVAGNPPALANLRVCFNDMNVNCGRCLKCRRTMVSLALLGAGPGPFPPLSSDRGVRRMPIAGPIEMGFFLDNLRLAQESANVPLRKALLTCLRIWERQNLFKDFDKLFLGGMFKKFRGWIGEGGFHRIDTTAAGSRAEGRR